MSDSNKAHKPSKFLLVVGILLICIGAANLIDRLLPPQIIMAVSAFVRGMWSVAWPLALIALGVYVLWAAKTGKLSNFRAARGQGSLRRSRADKRFMGVCGGIARYFGADSSVVRVIAVLLLVFLTPTALIAYIVMGVVLPSE